jgi:intracellular septation protein
MGIVERYLNRHILLEIAPGIVFLIVNYAWDLMMATAAVIIATVVFTVLGIFAERRIPVFPIVTVLLVLILGGAAIVFKEALFIKIKPTIGNCLFAVTLIFGLLLHPSLLVRALEGQVYLTDKGWKVLTIRWVLFALLMAGANEIIWRTQDTDTWVAFKASMTPVSIFAYIVITRFTARTFWQETAIDT